MFDGKCLTLLTVERGKGGGLWEEKGLGEEKELWEEKGLWAMVAGMKRNCNLLSLKL